MKIPGAPPSRVQKSCRTNRFRMTCLKRLLVQDWHWARSSCCNFCFAVCYSTLSIPPISLLARAAAGAYLVLAAPALHSQRAADETGDASSGSASSASTCGRTTASASEILAFRLLAEDSTYSEIYYYEDSDERQHPLFVHPPPLSTQTVGSGRADTVEAAALNHPRYSNWQHTTAISRPCRSSI